MKRWVLIRHPHPDTLDVQPVRRAPAGVSGPCSNPSGLTAGFRVRFNLPARSAGAVCGVCSRGVCRRGAVRGSGLPSGGGGSAAGGAGQTPAQGRARAALPPWHVMGVRDDDQLGVGDDGGPLLLPHRLRGGGRPQCPVPAHPPPGLRGAGAREAAPSLGEGRFPPPGCAPPTSAVITYVAVTLPVL